MQEGGPFFWRHINALLNDNCNDGCGDYYMMMAIVPLFDSSHNIRKCSNH